MLAGIISVGKSVNSDNSRRKINESMEVKLIEIACVLAREDRSKWTLLLLDEKLKVELEIPVGKDAIGRTLQPGFPLTHN